MEDYYLPGTAGVSADGSITSSRSIAHGVRRLDRSGCVNGPAHPEQHTGHTLTLMSNTEIISTLCSVQSYWLATVSGRFLVPMVYGTSTSHCTQVYTCSHDSLLRMYFYQLRSVPVPRIMYCTHRRYDARARRRGM